MTELSRAAAGDKKNDPLPVRYNDAQMSFISGMCELHGFRNDCEYLRHLVDEEMKRKARELNLMALALGAKVNTEHLVNGGDK